jgi:hypothetical protein
VVIRTAIAFTALAAATPAARAERTALAVSGSAPPHARDVTATAVTAELHVHGDDVAKIAIAAKELACATADQPWACIAASARGHAATQVALVQVEPSATADGSTTIVVSEQLLADGLDSAATGERYCTHCTDDVLARLAAELTRELAHTVAVMRGRTVISVRSTPRGARITLDGQLEGATDTAIATYPGPHTVSLELEGFQPATRTVDAADGKTAELAIPLVPAPTAVPTRATSSAAPPPVPPPLAPPPAHHRRALPIVVVGLGVAAIAAGGVALALDGSPVIGAHTPIASPYYYTTTGPGIAAIAGGAVVAGVGAYLWWRFARSDTAPAIAATSGGAVLGVSHAF